MAWSRKSTLIAGLGLILVTNAVALGGAAYNRSGEPESILHLTERELQPPHDWGRNRENSGLALTLRWRTLGEEAGNRMGAFMSYYPGINGSPKWLDESKLAALGFDVSPRRTSDDQVNYGRLLAREVLLVLELNGSAYKMALERMREHAAHEEALNAASANNKEFEQRAKAAREQLAREENEYSRLFVVDAGLELEALRTKYPDRTRYAIVRGQVLPQWSRNGNEKPRFTGLVTGVSEDRISVPLAFHPALPPAPASNRTGMYSLSGPSDVTVAFGRRLEPWISAVAKR